MMYLKMGATYNVDWKARDIALPGKVKVIGTLNRDGAEEMYPEFVAQNSSMIGRDTAIYIVKAANGEKRCLTEHLVNGIEEETVKLFARVMLMEVKSSEIDSEYLEKQKVRLGLALEGDFPDYEVVDVRPEGEDPAVPQLVAPGSPADQSVPGSTNNDDNNEMMVLMHLTGSLPNEIRRSGVFWQVRGTKYRFATMMSKDPKEVLVQMVGDKYVFEVTETTPEQQAKIEEEIGGEKEEGENG